MSIIRIWALESDNDAKAVKCLANELVTHLQLKNLSIQVSGRQAVPKRRYSDDMLKTAVQNYLNEATCVIFVIDSDGPISSYQRQQEPNSLINQIIRVIEDSSFTGKVFLIKAIQKLEAWLLIDCLGIFCYFASKASQYKKNCRDRVSENRSFKRLVDRHQKGNTENIVEVEIGGKGAKEYLIKFSEEILLALNPQKPNKNINRERYREHMSPEVAEHVLIDQNTLRRNNSLRELGNLLTQFQSVENR